MMRRPNDISITAFFPAFNDEATIGPLVTQMSGTLSKLTSDFEIIVVNDGSTDSTASVLNELLNVHPHLRVVSHETNRGYGGALRSGFRAATKELVFYTDGDAQYDVNELAKLHSALIENIDVVNGYKMNRADGFHRKVIGSLYAALMRKGFRLPIRDVDCDFRLIRRRALDGVELQFDSGAICVELVKKLSTNGSVFAEVGVNHYPRTSGRSQFLRPRRILKTFLDLGRLWFHVELQIKRNGVAAP